MNFLPTHISEKLLDSVAEQIGKQITYVAPALHKVELELGETYLVWGLKKSAYVVPLKELEAQAFAVPTHSWHHQVKAQEKAVAFARSVWVPAPTPKLSVAELVVGHVARTVDDAFRWFWSAIPEQADARLLVIPSLYVHAFWLLDSENPVGRVVIADAPGELSAFKKKELLSVQQFLERVRHYMQPSGAGGAEPQLTGFGSLLPFFRGSGLKQLSATDVDLGTSHGSEIQGVAKLRELLGTPEEPQELHAVTVYLEDSNLASPPRQDGSVTWYDTRKQKAGRKAEWRLYYKSHGSLIHKLARRGDSLFFTESGTNVVYLLIAKAGSEVEQHLRWLLALEPMLGATHDAKALEKTAKLVLSIAQIGT